QLRRHLEHGREGDDRHRDAQLDQRQRVRRQLRCRDGQRRSHQGQLPPVGVPADPERDQQPRIGRVVPAVKKTKAKAKPKAKPVAKQAAKKPAAKREKDVARTDPALFDPLTPGEVADALRTLTEDKRVVSMAKVGRYRVICAEPLVVKPPHWMAGHRLARIVAYDYSQDRAVDACVDLDAGVVAHLDLNKSQPMLSREEELIAIEIAMTDTRVSEKLHM